VFTLRQKQKVQLKVGIEVIDHHLPEETTEARIIKNSRYFK
jgi:single-stranded DNA-specific DHH superfamily exonuclease